MNTVLLAQDSARIAGITAGRLLMPVLGLILISVGIWRRTHSRPGARHRGTGWMIGVGVVLVLATLAGTTAAGARGA